MFASNVGGFPKYMWQMLASNLCGVVKHVRLHNIRYIQDGRWNLCAYQNICAKCMRPSENWCPNSYYLGSNFWLLPSLAKELSFRWCCLSFMWSSSDLSTQDAQLIWAASLPYCTGCCTGTTCQNICVLSKNLRAHIFSPFPGEKSKTYPITSLQIRTWSQKLSKFSCNTFKPLNRGRPRFWPRTLKLFKFSNGGYVGGGGGEGEKGNRRNWPPLSHSLEAGVRGGGEGEGREKRERTRPWTKCSLHALCLSFSYLRSAVTASFNIKKFHRNCTTCKTKEPVNNPLSSKTVHNHWLTVNTHSEKIPSTSESESNFET